MGTVGKFRRGAKGATGNRRKVVPIYPHLSEAVRRKMIARLIARFDGKSGYRGARTAVYRASDIQE